MGEIVLRRCEGDGWHWELVDDVGAVCARSPCYGSSGKAKRRALFATVLMGRVPPRLRYRWDDVVRCNAQKGA